MAHKQIQARGNGCRFRFVAIGTICDDISSTRLPLITADITEDLGVSSLGTPMREQDALKGAFGL